MHNVHICDIHIIAIERWHSTARRYNILCMWHAYDMYIWKLDRGKILKKAGMYASHQLNGLTVTCNTAGYLTRQAGPLIGFFLTWRRRKKEGSKKEERFVFLWFNVCVKQSTVFFPITCRTAGRLQARHTAAAVRFEPFTANALDGLTCPMRSG